MSAKNPRSRWLKATRRLTSALIEGAWNRNLQQRDRAPDEFTYVGSFAPAFGWRGGARVRKR